MGCAGNTWITSSDVVPLCDVTQGTDTPPFEAAMQPSCSPASQHRADPSISIALQKDGNYC